MNPNCDGSHCVAGSGEVRLLPLGGGANLILCRACYEHEMRWRRSENRRVASPYAIPEWDALQVYGGAPADLF